MSTEAGRRLGGMEEKETAVSDGETAVSGVVFFAM
jgi:hypothetical protein